MKPKALAAYEPFVARLRSAAANRSGADTRALLDGAAAEALRKSVGLGVRQKVGAFFTSTRLADRCLNSLIDLPIPITDPACGAGDLLLAVARRLPIGSSAAETLALWGNWLYGTDIVPEFVTAARLRLALLAMERTGDRVDARTANRLLRNIRVGNGLSTLKECTIDGLLIINPPFGMTSSFRQHFNGSGRVARAGIFVDSAIRALKPGASLVSILPDVLRSGTTYRRWRQTVGKQLDSVHISVEGRFDDATDVDVFTLAGRKASDPTRSTLAIDWYKVTLPAGSEPLRHFFDFHVGHIVEYRDEGHGRRRAFITVRDMVPGTVQLRIKNWWPAGGRIVETPFVAICRTSSPHDGQRVVASVISGKRPVAVENHIITARPRSGKLSDAIQLMDWLKSSEVTDHLQRRIRCRHLTVGALEDLPSPQPSKS